MTDLHSELRHPEASETPLVCIHGVGSSSSSWGSVLELLPPDRPILTFDLRGHGDSEKVPGPYHMADFVADLIQLLDAHQYSRVHLAGFSLGGLIAQAAAVQHPERVSKLVLIGTVAGRSPEEQERVMARLAEIERDGPGAVAERSVQRWHDPEFLRKNPEVRQQTIDRMSALDPDCYSSAYRVLATSDFVQDLHRISAPTLAIAGEGDIGSPPHMSHTIAESVLHGRSVVIPGIRHDILEAAPDITAKEIHEHLTGS